MLKDLSQTLKIITEWQDKKRTWLTRKKREKNKRAKRIKVIIWKRWKRKLLTNNITISNDIDLYKENAWDKIYWDKDYLRTFKEWEKIMIYVYINDNREIDRLRDR